MLLFSPVRLFGFFHFGFFLRSVCACGLQRTDEELYRKFAAALVIQEDLYKLAQGTKLEGT